MILLPANPHGQSSIGAPGAIGLWSNAERKAAYFGLSMSRISNLIALNTARAGLHKGRLLKEGRAEKFSVFLARCAIANVIEASGAS
jgi:hypothetical protein